MNLKILLPFQVFTTKTGVLRVIVETSEGAFGFLPRRLDCVAALVPGILTYETKEEGTAYVAVDEGVLVKVGDEVMISVRRAIGGSDLGQLHAAVRREFMTVDDGEREMRAAMSGLEGGFLRRFAAFKHAR